MDDDSKKEGAEVSPELRSAWRFSIIQQAAIFLTVGMMNDSGVRLRAAAGAAAVYWAVVWFIYFLRRAKPIFLDLVFARWSYPLLWLAFVVILMRIGKMKVG